MRRNAAWPHERFRERQALAFQWEIYWIRVDYSTPVHRLGLTRWFVSFVRGIGGADWRRLARPRALDNLHGVSWLGLDFVLVSERRYLLIDRRVILGAPFS